MANNIIMHLHEIEIVPMSGFYFQMPQCEVGRNDINVYIEWYQVGETNYWMRAYASTTGRDNSRFQFYSHELNVDDIQQGYDHIVGLLNDSDEFVDGIKKYVSWITENGL